MRQHKIPLGWFLGLTLATVVISLPLGPTLGKYVWDEQVESIIWRSPPLLPTYYGLQSFKYFLRFHKLP